MRMPNPRRVIIIPRDAAPASVSPDIAMPLPERDDMGPEHEYSGRQMQQQVAYQRVVEVFGKFDQTAGPDGAHYMDANPFKKDGIACANCVFYEGPRGCEIVEGEIDPDAICKLWVIPGDLMKEGGEPKPANPKKRTIVEYEKGNIAVKAARSEASALPDRQSALRLARRLGCEGAHQTENGWWAPCANPSALKKVIDGQLPKADTTDRERGVAGIETLPDGSLVSQKMAEMTDSVDAYIETKERRTDLR